MSRGRGGLQVAKVSMAQAAKLFAVSRPTLLKHLQQGKITGEKTTVDKNTFWQIDMAELSRAYPRRDDPAPPRHDGLTNPVTPDSPDLQAEIRVLQAKLEAAEKLADAGATVELTGTSAEVDAFIEVASEHGLLEVARSGRLAFHRQRHLSL